MTSLILSISAADILPVHVEDPLVYKNDQLAN